MGSAGMVGVLGNLPYLSFCLGAGKIHRGVRWFFLLGPFFDFNKAFIVQSTTHFPDDCNRGGESFPTNHRPATTAKLAKGADLMTGTPA